MAKKKVEGKTRHTDKVSIVMDEITNKLYKDMMTFQEVTDWLMSEKGYTRNTAQGYIYDAKRDYFKVMLENKLELRDESIQYFENLRSRAKADGDKRLEKDITIEIARLRGEYVDKVEVTTVDFKIEFGK